MPRFAHMADVHLGAFREEELRKLNLEAFSKALDACMQEQVDFIIIAGDLFHINIPDLAVVDEAVRKMREVREKGIRIYAVYGSHDYSPTETSVIDVLSSAGVIKKIVSGGYDGDKLKLEFVTDEKTGIKLAGLNARKKGLEKAFYHDLDVEALEKEGGTKIFVFHSAIDEFKSSELEAIESIPFSLFPKGFAYYAGGHVHERLARDKVVFPGPLFASDFRDLENLSKRKSGFYLVEIEDSEVRPQFHEVNVCESAVIECDAEGRTAQEAAKALSAEIGGKEVKGKIVLLKVRGELSAGKPSDIPFAEMREKLSKKGTRVVYVNRNSLRSKERQAIKVTGETREEIEDTLFAEHFGREKNTAKKLFAALKQDHCSGTRKDYEEAVAKKAREVLLP